jgi:hypothetical protein
MSISLFLTCRVNWQAYLQREGPLAFVVTFCAEASTIARHIRGKRSSSSISEGVIPHRDVIGWDEGDP